MISLGQIRLLEEKIEKVIQRIKVLEEENKTLVEKNLLLNKEKENLLYRISSFEADQEQIEKGILNALDRLNTMETAVIKETISNTLKSQDLQPKSEQNQKLETENLSSSQSPQIEVEAKQEIEIETDDIEIEIEDEIEIPSTNNEQNSFDIF